MRCNETIVISSGALLSIAVAGKCVLDRFTSSIAQSIFSLLRNVDVSTFPRKSIGVVSASPYRAWCISYHDHLPFHGLRTPTAVKTDKASSTSWTETLVDCYKAHRVPTASGKPTLRTSSRDHILYTYLHSAEPQPCSQLRPPTFPPQALSH